MRSPLHLAFWAVLTVATRPVSEAFVFSTAPPKRITKCQSPGCKQQPWVQPNLGLHYSTGNELTKVVNDQDPSIHDAYQTVADLDPHWYKKFVMNVLGEKAAEDIGLPKSIPSALKVPAKTVQSSLNLDDKPTVTNINANINASEKKELGGSLSNGGDPSEGVAKTKIAPVETEEDDGRAIQEDSTTAMVEQGKQSSNEGKTGPTLAIDPATLGESTAVDQQQQQEESSGEPTLGKNITNDLQQEQKPEESLESTVETQVQMPEALASVRNASSESNEAVDKKSVEAVSSELGNIISKAIARTDSPVKGKSTNPSMDGGSNRKKNDDKTQAQKIGLPETVVKESQTKRSEDSTKDDTADVGRSETQSKTSTPAESSEQSLRNEDELPRKEVTDSKQTSLKIKTEAPKDELVVAYKLDGQSLAEPLSTLKELGYATADVVMLQSDAVDLIIADNTAKPKSGIPRKWQNMALRGDKRKSPNELDSVEVMTSSAFAALQEGRRGNKSENKSMPTDTYSGRRSSVPEAKEQQTCRDQATQSSSRRKVTRNDERQEKESAVEANTDGIPFGQQFSSLEGRKEAEGAKMSELEGLTNAEGDQGLDNAGRGGNQSHGDEVAVYFDPNIDKIRLTPLKNFIVLGYTKKEILSLRQDIVATIASERRPKPHEGVPSHWCNAKGDTGGGMSETVRVLVRSEVDEFVKAPRRTRKARKGESERRRPSQEKRRRSRDRSAVLADGQKKAMYNGRPRSDSMPRGMPMPVMTPKPPMLRWMDLDTFRNLLRTEAEMRVRITGELGGNDFADAIKDECDMRLGLYEGWLRTVDHGIGKPLVPSRRERGVISPRIRKDTGMRRSTRPGRKSEKT